MDNYKNIGITKDVDTVLKGDAVCCGDAPTLATTLRKITDTEVIIEDLVCDISRVLFGSDDAVKNPKPNKEANSMAEELEYLLQNITGLSRAIHHIRINLC